MYIDFKVKVTPYFVKFNYFSIKIFHIRYPRLNFQIQIMNINIIIRIFKKKPIICYCVNIKAIDTKKIVQHNYELKNKT